MSSTIVFLNHKISWEIGQDWGEASEGLEGPWEGAS